MVVRIILLCKVDFLLMRGSEDAVFKIVFVLWLSLYDSLLLKPSRLEGINIRLCNDKEEAV